MAEEPGPSKEDVLASAFKGEQPEGFILKSFVTENTPDPSKPGVFSVAFKIELEASEDLCRLLDNETAFSKYKATFSKTDPRVAFAEIITPKGSVLPIHGKVSAERIVDRWMCRILETDKPESAAVQNAGTKLSSLVGIIRGELIPIPSERATAFFKEVLARAELEQKQSTNFKNAFLTALAPNKSYRLTSSRGAVTDFSISSLDSTNSEEIQIDGSVRMVKPSSEKLKDFIGKDFPMKGSACLSRDKKFYEVTFKSKIGDSTFVHSVLFDGTSLSSKKDTVFGVTYTFEPTN